MLIDTHAHLSDPLFDNDRSEVIERALASGVEYMIAVSYDLESARRSSEIVKGRDFIHQAIGIHPNESLKYAGDYAKKFDEIFQREKKVAIGEIGLDYYRDSVPRDVQMDVFKKFLKKGADCGLPVVIHNREADNDILNAIGDFPSGALKGVFHCFSGSAEFAKKVIDLGFYVSFAGQITFSKAEDLRITAMKIPIENIMLETDCPYLAPQKFRGKRNEPSYVKDIAEVLARVKGLSYDDICRITTFNVKNLFGIGAVDDLAKIAYKIRDSLYLNITNECSNACTFCVRYYSDYVKGHNLKLSKEPSYEEIIKAIGDLKSYKEVVFCGYGEPLSRLDVVKKVAAYIKAKGVPVRIDTNGHGNLINGRPVASELKGLVDSISVSLNAETEQKYNRICQPRFGAGTYVELKNFVLECKKYIPNVTVTVVDMPGVDVDACRKIAKNELGVELRLRKYDEVG